MKKSLTPETAFAAAIQKAGDKAKLARIAGVTAQAVGKWTTVPALRAIAVEKATGISRHDLAPKYYPREGKWRG